MDIYQLTVAVVGSALAGAINTLAGNGSAITLTILTEIIGLSPNMANGTNRLGIFSQSLVGAWEFHRGGKLDLQRGKRYIVPMTVGAIAGVLVAVWVSNEQFKAVFSYLMILMLVVLLAKPSRWISPESTQKEPSNWLVIPVFLCLGFYGGFIQMGMGIFFLAIMVLGIRFTLTEGNAIKVLIVGLYTIIVIAIFQWKGLIDWKVGGVMAVGQSIGGWLTAKYASRYPQADAVAYWVLVVIVVLAVAKLFNLHHWVGGLLN